MSSLTDGLLYEPSYFIDSIGSTNVHSCLMFTRFSRAFGIDTLEGKEYIQVPYVTCL